MKAKVTVIGAGNVGATLGQYIALEGLADVVLVDIAEGIPQGKALDMHEACPLWGSAATVTGTNDYEATAGSDVIVMTGGLARKPGMSRDDLLAANAEIVSGATRAAAEKSPDAIVIVVTNPMDAMAYAALRATGLPATRVIGMGGVLDSARLRAFVSMELGVAPSDVEGMVLGGHGDDMVPMPRFTTVRGVPITELLPPDRIEALIERTRKGGAEIVNHLKTGSAYYAPAAATTAMVRAILRDEKRLLPCSAMLEGQYGVSGIYLGVPAVLGKEGVERIVELKLDEIEQVGLEKSIISVRSLIDSIDKSS